jgi:hypothetical protein
MPKLTRWAALLQYVINSNEYIKKYDEMVNQGDLPTVIMVSLKV